MKSNLKRSEKLKALKQVLEGKVSISEILDSEPTEEVFIHRPASETFERKRTGAVYTEAKLIKFSSHKPNARRTIFLDTTFPCAFQNLNNEQLRERFGLREEEIIFSMQKTYEPEKESELLKDLLASYESETLDPNDEQLLNS